MSIIIKDSSNGKLPEAVKNTFQVIASSFIETIKSSLANIEIPVIAAIVGGFAAHAIGAPSGLEISMDPSFAQTGALLAFAGITAVEFTSILKQKLADSGFAKENIAKLVPASSAETSKHNTPKNNINNILKTPAI
jgi:hypothetical protein